MTKIEKIGFVLKAGDNFISLSEAITHTGKHINVRETSFDYASVFFNAYLLDIGDRNTRYDFMHRIETGEYTKVEVKTTYTKEII